MFTTFNARTFRHDIVQTQSNEASGKEIRFTGKSRRSQVTRACDLCRINRTKCDTGQPCKNCRSKGARCSNNGRAETRTLAAATKEVDRLRQRITELEEELHNHAIVRHETTETSCNNSPEPPRDLTDLPVLNTKYTSLRPWYGFWSSCYSSDDRQLFGPLSSFAFTQRLWNFLRQALHHGGNESALAPISASAVFSSPSGSRLDGATKSYSETEGSDDLDQLSRPIEEQYIELFWETYHCTIPIIHKLQFEEHYNSLWIAGTNVRSHSPLVDIIVALCLQYGKALLPANRFHGIGWNDVPDTDPSIAGGSFYRRVQSTLTTKLERPSISTVQCYIFSALFLQNASFFNMAHNTVAVGIRTAYTLGLHQQPPNNLPQAEQELRKRLWWCLCSLDAKLSITLGTPFNVELSQVSCPLPDDTDKASLVAIGNYVTSFLDISFMTYQAQCIKMISLMRSLFTSILNESARLLKGEAKDSIYASPESTEALALHLASNIRLWDEWASQVPKALLLPHLGSSTEPFPATRQSFVLSNSGPTWLQRQRVLLALRYYDLTIAIYRPFIRFPSDMQGSVVAHRSKMPLAASHGTLCMQHALTQTNLIYQLLTETEILTGWCETYRYQWNATISLLGFIFSSPLHDSVPAVRSAIDTAIKVLEILGKKWAVAASAVVLVKNLVLKADKLVGSFSNSSLHAQDNTMEGTSSHTSVSPSPNLPTAGSASLAAGPESSTDPLSQTLSGDFAEFNMDDWTDFNILIADGNLGGDLWSDFIDSGY